MHRIHTVVSFDDELDEKSIELCGKANLRLLRYSEVLQKGREIIKTGDYKETLP